MLTKANILARVHARARERWPKCHKLSSLLGALLLQLRIITSHIMSLSSCVYVRVEMISQLESIVGAGGATFVSGSLLLRTYLLFHLS